ncbi:class I SAM-dependent methyltransferase [Paracoccus sp. 11-3]|uniref:Class I SAM-dependent methyltransferase n=1 Tax=Paracoccus amoyensis TaxID=2760093 RepID=A0A926GDH0_9RHOB|nr:cyclopropane-fatty-acyl-phospholipid synthase family protein [Paracoccus amoyensis]MBC9246481.1 class I SAM-dependent methyltransferase [Paracoccus amoyensis]
MLFESRLTSQFLDAVAQIQHGTLAITTPDGVLHEFQGPHPGPHGDLAIHDWRAIAALAARGDIGMTEAYRDHWCDTRDLEALIMVAMLNIDALHPYIFGRRWQALITRALYALNRNSRSGAKRNIRAHYDLGNDFYSLWLDESMTYSSALFQPDDDLHMAQQRKYDRIIDHLAGASGRLLEIGCGWGGFAERALERGDFAPKGLTLSHEQADYARERLGPHADIALQDYRDETSRYDHVVSIEMFEAVGERYWPTYFGKLAQVLSDKGRAMIQTITIADDLFNVYRRGPDMIRSFIFPGGMLPSPSRFEAEASRAGLRIEESFNFGFSYARTLREWLKRFDLCQVQVRAMGFDDEFIRVWRMYLAACAASFATGRTDVVQYQLSHA